MHNLALQISVPRISEVGLDFELSLGEEWFSRWQEDDHDLEFAGPGNMDARVHLEKHGHDVLVRGAARRHAEPELQPVSDPI